MTKAEKKSIPVYRQIYETLKEQLTTGVYPPESLFPPERVLAKEFSVSHLTIRKSLSLLVEENYIRREAGTGTIVMPQTNGRPAQAKRLSSISIILDEVDSYFSKLVNFLETSCRSRDLILNMFCYKRDPQLLKQQYEKAASLEESLIIMVPNGIYENWLKFHPSRFQTIIVDDTTPIPEIPQVISDDLQGTYQLTKYLSDLGHKIIAHVGAESKISGHFRKQGWEKGIQDFGLSSSPSLYGNGDFLSSPSAQVFSRILDKHPDCKACICANDYAAFGVIQELTKRNQTVGKDFSVTGYGNYDISEVIGLTSVDQLPERISEQIFLLIDTYLRAGQLPTGTFTVPVEVKLRNSCTAK